jgi:ABC-2 type transport system ATP-binding protein
VASGTPEDLVGRDRDEAVVRFRLPRELAIEDLPAELWTVTSHDGDNLVVRTPRPTRALWLLTGWAAQAGVELDALTVERPTLEDTYLELVATQPEESHP